MLNQAEINVIRCIRSHLITAQANIGKHTGACRGPYVELLSAASRITQCLQLCELIDPPPEEPPFKPNR